MVMWGHVQTINSPIKQFLSLFYVQVFLVITGYLYFKREKHLCSIKDIAKKVMIPFIFFSVFAILMDIIVFWVQGKNVANIFMVDLYKTVTLFGIFALWYLPAYFMSSTIFLFINDRMSNVMKFLTILFLVFLSVFCSYVLKSLQMNLPNMIYNLIYYPLASIARSFACVLYISVGFEIGKYRLLERLSKYERTIYGVLLLVITFLLSIISGTRNFSMLEFGKSPWTLLIGGISGSLGFLALLFGLKDKTKGIITFFGKYSLLFLITHMTFKINNLSQYIVSLFLEKNNLLYSVIALLIMLLFCVPIVYLFNKKLQFFIYGIKKKAEIDDK